MANYTKLLLHMDGTDGSTTFTDSSIYNRTASVFGNAQIDTAQSKFGGASGYFDKNGDYLTFPASSDFAMGTGDFTIDFWVRIENANGNHVIQGQNAFDNFSVYINDISDAIGVYLDTGGYTFAWAPSTGTWYHIAITRASSSLRCFVDGTQIGTTQTSNDNIQTGSDTLYIGTDGASTYFGGWLDEYRISKGIARWTSNFTPPTSAYDDPSSTSSSSSSSSCRSSSSSSRSSSSSSCRSSSSSSSCRSSSSSSCRSSSSSSCRSSSSSSCRSSSSSSCRSSSSSSCRSSSSSSCRSSSSSSSCRSSSSSSSSSCRSSSSSSSCRSSSSSSSCRSSSSSSSSSSSCRSSSSSSCRSSSSSSSSCRSSSSSSSSCRSSSSSSCKSSSSSSCRSSSSSSSCRSSSSSSRSSSSSSRSSSSSSSSVSHSAVLKEPATKVSSTITFLKNYAQDYVKDVNADLDTVFREINRGFRPDRLTTAQRDALTELWPGRTVYNTETNKLNIYTVSGWQQVTSA